MAARSTVHLFRRSRSDEIPFVESLSEDVLGEILSAWFLSGSRPMDLDANEPVRNEGNFAVSDLEVRVRPRDRHQKRPFAGLGIDAANSLSTKLLNSRHRALIAALFLF